MSAGFIIMMAARIIILMVARIKIRMVAEIIIWNDNFNINLEVACEPP